MLEKPKSTSPMPPSIIFFSDLLDKVILPRKLVKIETAADGVQKFNFLIINDIKATSYKIFEQKPLYISQHLDEELLQLLINLIFSNYLSDAFEYFKNVHPTRIPVTINYPEFMYLDLIKLLFDEHKPARLLFEYKTVITVNPINITERGLASAFLLISNLLEAIVKIVKERETVEEKEIIEDFYEKIRKNPSHKNIINNYLEAKEEYLKKIAELKKEERRDITGPSGIVPKVFSDFYATPCLKKMIERGIKGVNLEHNERVILLQILKYFFDDKDLHKFYSSQPDYDWGITQRMIDHNRKRAYNPVNCQRIIYWKYCPCRGPPGCCGTKIYIAYKFPDEVYERVKKFRGEK